MAKLLLEKGAGTGGKDSHGMTARDYAERSGIVELKELLAGK